MRVVTTRVVTTAPSVSVEASRARLGGAPARAEPAGPGTDQNNRPLLRLDRRRPTASDGAGTTGTRSGSPAGVGLEQYFFHDGQGQYGELPQLDKGYVGSDTDIVTLSIGGNDVLFTDILQWCVAGDCQEKIVGSDQRRVGLASPQQIEVVVGPAVRIVLDQIRLKPRTRRSS